jgi:hypothetical protein
MGVSEEMVVLLRAPPLTAQSAQGNHLPLGPNAKHTSQIQLSEGTLTSPTQRWCRLMLHIEQNTIKLSYV